MHGCRIGQSKLQRVSGPRTGGIVLSNGIETVVNCAVSQCDTIRPGTYGPDVDVVLIELNDDPDVRKTVDAMEEGEGKDAARAALLSLPDADDAAGDAKKDFEMVNRLITDTRSAGGATLIHCYASISRSAAFILAYMMREEGIDCLVNATTAMKEQWNATWPCDAFVEQLVAYETEMRPKGPHDE